MCCDTVCVCGGGGARAGVSERKRREREMKTVYLRFVSESSCTYTSKYTRRLLCVYTRRLLCACLCLAARDDGWRDTA